MLGRNDLQHAFQPIKTFLKGSQSRLHHKAPIHPETDSAGGIELNGQNDK